MKVAVLGASPKPERYANRVLHALQAHGHEPVGVNPAKPDLGSVNCVATLDDLPEGIDTLTVYVGPERSTELADSIVAKGFRRVIFNPGAENPPLLRRLSEAGTEAIEACSLVMLSTRQF